MAVDHYTVTWHLTPNGWVSGNSTDFGKLDGKLVERPEDALESWIYEVYQKSAYSAEEKTWERIWSKPDVSGSIISELHNKYPKVVTTP
jgi:hypothetical protein